MKILAFIELTFHFSSVRFSHSVVSDSLPPCGLQDARLPCPSPTPIVYSSSCALSLWCHPTVSSSCPQSFPASGSFPVSQRLTSGGQRTGVSASASVLPMNIQDWFKMDWLDLLAVQGTLKSLLQHHSSKASILPHSAFFKVQLSHPYMTTGKTITFTKTFVGKVMSLLFNMLSSLVITFLLRSKCLFNFMAGSHHLQFSPERLVWDLPDLPTSDL